MGKLTTCKTCEQPVAESTFKCPHCGETLKKEQWCRSWKGGVISFALAFIMPYPIGFLCKTIGFEEGQAVLIAVLFMIAAIVTGLVFFTKSHVK